MTLWYWSWVTSIRSMRNALTPTSWGFASDCVLSPIRNRPAAMRTRFGAVVGALVAGDAFWARATVGSFASAGAEVRSQPAQKSSPKTMTAALVVLVVITQ